MKQKKGMIIALAAVGIVALAAVALAGNMSKLETSSSTGSAAADTSDAVATTSVAIQSYKYEPAIIRVKVGDTVTWTNNDSVRHNVAADTPTDAAPNGPLIGKGETYSFKFTKAGTYKYHCDPHPHMHGTVIVTE